MFNLKRPLTAQILHDAIAHRMLVFTSGLVIIPRTILLFKEFMRVLAGIRTWTLRYRPTESKLGLK